MSSSNFTSNFTFVDVVEEHNILIPFIRFILIFLLRAGTVIIQLGTFPTENVYNIIFQNILDIAVSILSFTLVGFSITYSSNDISGFIGYGLSIDSKNADYGRALFGYCAVLLGSGIVSMIMAGRLHCLGSILINLAYSSLCLPIVMHCIWHENGWFRRIRYYGKELTFLDYGGGLIIHATAGSVGLIGSLFLGRRVLLLNEIHESSIGTESPSNTILGYFFIATGLFAMLLPLEFDVLNQLNPLIINGINSMMVGILVIMILQTIVYGKQLMYWNLLRCVQGGIAALVLTSHGIIDYSLSSCILITLFGTIIFFFVSRCIQISDIEDNSNAIAIHFVCGLLGSFFPHILSSTKTDTIQHISQCALWQILISFAIIFVNVIIFTFLFFILKSCNCLHSKGDKINHQRSKHVLSKSDSKTFLQRFINFRNEDDVLEPGKTLRGILTSRCYSKEPNDGLIRDQSFTTEISDYDCDKLRSSEESARNTSSYMTRSPSVFRLEELLECNDDNAKGDFRTESCRSATERRIKVDLSKMFDTN